MDRASSGQPAVAKPAAAYSSEVKALAVRSIRAATHFTEGLHGLAAAVFIGNEPQPPGVTYAEHVAADINKGHDALDTRRTEFKDCLVSLHAQAPKDVVEHADKLWKLYWEIRDGSRQFVSGLSPSMQGMNMAHKGQERVESARAELQDTLERLKKSLRRISVGEDDA